MSVWKEIRCDADAMAYDCLSGTNAGPKGFESASALQAEARRNGWLIRSGGEAICPRCRALQMRLSINAEKRS